MFVVMYFLMIRPQQKRQKEMKSMMEALAKGDEVVTAGGILGRVVQVKDAYVTLEVAAGTEMVVQKNAVTTLLPKGTLKSL
jgi:preprotein translocase subunit YajC